jgi:hypothetical protein
MAYSRACANSWVKVEVRLDGDFQEDANHLHLKREAERVEFCDRSLRQDLVAAIEADQVLDLLCHREMPPARRQIGDARHSREGNNAAVFGPDAELALSLERRAWHLTRMWRPPGAVASSPSRARVRRRFPRAGRWDGHLATPLGDEYSRCNRSIGMFPIGLREATSAATNAVCRRLVDYRGDEP